jgi:hypothetical protein
VAAQLAASQEGLSSMLLSVNESNIISVILIPLFFRFLHPTNDINIESFDVHSVKTEIPKIVTADIQNLIHKYNIT